MTNRHSRDGDPWTSEHAGNDAAKAAQKSAAMVARVMADGVPRIDEEIWRHAKDRFDYKESLDRIRHGRLALVEAKKLIDSGTTRHTERNRPSRVWALPTRL